jgi:hypothetical protein
MFKSPFAKGSTERGNATMSDSQLADQRLAPYCGQALIGYVRGTCAWKIAVFLTLAREV